MCELILDIKDVKDLIVKINMSLDSILERINIEAIAQKEKIIQAAKDEAEGIILEGQKQAEKFYQEGMAKEETICERKRQGIIVNARLKARNNLLSAKQEMIDRVFKKFNSELGKGNFKKQLISIEKIKEVDEDSQYYLENLRYDYESEIAKILFE